jgi:hypothetical protein
LQAGGSRIVTDKVHQVLVVVLEMVTSWFDSKSDCPLGALGRCPLNQGGDESSILSFIDYQSSRNTVE